MKGVMIILMWECQWDSVVGIVVNAWFKGIGE